MSLADQSQQWYPTSVQVTVHQARNLRVKGKNGTNDSYAIIQVAKDKFSTSVAEKCVDPVWKEEASFDLPLFHPGNAERCTLYIIVMHRAHVGLDKFLGQAVLNLLELYDNKSRKKTDWFKLVDKTGKEDKARGEVLLDIQFMRNNMSASMFDLSMQDKPRSRISKLKDKVRGKKKDGFSDSASAIVPSVSQVLTDSEGEADAQSLSQSPGTKKKSKLKTLFAPKSNLQRNMSQSMSTLGTLPEKNSSLSGSRSSGLNVDSPDVKKKFKFLGHKRTGSSDSKVSLGPFSLLGRSKQSNSDLNNLCINGSHVYTEETEPKSGSTLSLNSSGQGSVEDVRKHTSDLSADAFKSVPTHKHESTDIASQEQQHHQEEEERRQAEERRIAEAKRLEEEDKHRAQLKRLQEEEERRQQEEQERKRRFLEDEARRKKQMEEEERRKQEEQRKMMEAAENQRLEEERRRAEEQKRQEEASMSERLSSLFGMIRKKEEKKEEVEQQAKEEQLPISAPPLDAKDPNQPNSHRSTNPFEDIPFSSDVSLSSNVSPTDHQKSSSKSQTSSAMAFLNRTAKVSAVKPRLAQSLEPEPADFQTPSQLCCSPANSESTLPSVPSGSPDTFSSLHSSLAPRVNSLSPSGSHCGSTENLSSVGFEGSSPTMADQKRKVLLPPLYGTQTRGNLAPVREIQNPAYVEPEGLQIGKNVSIPLPDYETLFPQRRHGVQGQTQWDHIIAEVNQKHRDAPVELMGPEMSVDGPVEHKPSPRSSVSPESLAMRHSQTKPQETKPVSTKKVPAPAPPKQAASPFPLSAADFSQRKSHNVSQQSPMTPSQPTVPASVRTDTSSRGMSGDGVRKVLQPSPKPAPRTPSQMDLDTTPSGDQKKATMNKEAPTAKPRQKVSAKEPTMEKESAVNSSIPTVSNSNMSSLDKKAKENFAELDPFPSIELSRDPWAWQKQNQEDYLFTSNVRREPTTQDQGITTNDSYNIFSQEKQTDPFASFNGSDSNIQSEYRKMEEDSKLDSPAFQRKNSQRGNKILPSTAPSQQIPPTANQGFRDVQLQPHTDVKMQSIFNGEDPFGAKPFFEPSEPLQVVMEEPETLSWGKEPLRAWVSPSEVQTVSTQNSSGSGLAINSRRPHPVKPMSTAESQSTHAMKEIKVQDSTPGKIKMIDSVESGPYTQLTQEELITMVVKQQADLTRKDAKIIELEEYIDNLVVRVIEEKPSILQALSVKPV